MFRLKLPVYLFMVALFQIAGLFLLASPVHAAGTARWVDNARISYDNRIYKDETGDGKIFLAQEDADGCADTLTLEGASANDGSLDISRAPADRTATLQVKAKSNNSCQNTSREENITVTAAGTNFTGAPTSCESAADDTGWIICPLLRQADKAINQLDKAIVGLLKIPNGYIDNPNLKKSWQTIRNIAYFLIIPLVLVMIISTALDFDFVSAYTVRKSFSRLLLAVMFITLSFAFTTFMIRFFNTIGSGTLGLITAPFRIDDISLASLFKSNNNLDAAALFSGTLLFGAAATVTSIGIIASYAFVTFLGVLTGFILLSLRQMLLVLLVLMAPLAILAWVFPGNDKLWKLWWNAFSKLLMLFPLVMILIGGGRVFASVVQDTAAAGGAGLLSSDNGLVVTFLKLVAYVAPYFFIPAAFKFAGGIFATVAGITNDRSKGLFDRQRKYRTEKRHHLKEAAGMGHRFNPNRAGLMGRVGRKLNTPAGWFAEPYNTARIKMNTQGGRSLMAGLTQKSAQQSQELANWMSAAGMNQEALTEVMQNVKRNHGHVNVRELNSTAQSWLRDPSKNTQYKAAAAQLLNSGQFLNDITGTEEYARANIGMAAGLAKASQGFLNNTGEGREGLNEAADYANFLNDLSPGLGDTFKTQAGLQSARAGGIDKVGYGAQAVYDAATGGVKYQSGFAGDTTILMREGPNTFMSAKGSALKKRWFNDDGGNVSVAKNLLRQNLTPGGPPAEINDGMDVAKIDYHSQRAVVDNIVQAAYGYNTPAETASLLRSKLQEYRNDTSINADLRSYIELREQYASRSLGNTPLQERDAPPPPPPGAPPS